MKKYDVSKGDFIMKSMTLFNNARDLNKTHYVVKFEHTNLKEFFYFSRWSQTDGDIFGGAGNKLPHNLTNARFNERKYAEAVALLLNNGVVEEVSYKEVLLCLGQSESRIEEILKGSK